MGIQRGGTAVTQDDHSQSEKTDAEEQITPAPSAGDTYQSTLPGPLGMIDNAISRVESALLAIGVLLMAANTIANIVARFVFRDSLFFSEELNRSLIVLITFAGISYAARQGRHIRMSAIYDEMPPKLRKALMIAMALITAVLMFGLAWYALQYILTLQGRGRVLPALSIPVWIIYVWVPVGFFMTALQYLLTAIKNIIEKDIYLSTNVLEGYDDQEIEI